MAIPTGNLSQFKQLGSIFEQAPVDVIPIKTFTLASFSDTAGIIDPQTSQAITCRGFISSVAGTLALVDPFGNATLRVVEANKEVWGFYNGFKSTGVVTILAANVTVFL